MAPRTLLCCLAVLALAGCGSDGDEAARPAATTDLTVRLDRDGRGPEPAERARLACEEPPESPACRAAAALRPADFEPVPDDVACTEQFGGPETATISGTLDGREVDARFARNNGCEIARWEKVAPLLEAAG